MNSLSRLFTQPFLSEGRASLDPYLKIDHTTSAPMLRSVPKTADLTLTLALCLSQARTHIARYRFSKTTGLVICSLKYSWMDCRHQFHSYNGTHSSPHTHTLIYKYIRHGIDLLLQCYITQCKQKTVYINVC